MAARGQAERLPRASIPVPLTPRRPLLVLKHSFLYSFVCVTFSICLSVVQKLPWSQRLWKGDSFWEKEGFPSTFSRSRCLAGIPRPSFYSLWSFVIFGRVSDTLVCLGNRVEGKSGSGDTRGGGEGQEGMTGAHADVDTMTLIRLTENMTSDKDH